MREVMVIGAEGKSKGVMATQEALRYAKSLGLDLVEISPSARPPVCKVLDYGKYKYEINKRDKQNRKQSSVSSQKVKELKFHVNIDEHDYMVKMRHAESFLFKGMKCKLLMVFRGREMAHKDIGHELMKKIIEDLSHVGSADYAPKMIGRNINMMLTPLPQNKRTRKFTADGADFEDEEADAQEADTVSEE